MKTYYSRSYSTLNRLTVYGEERGKRACDKKRLFSDARSESGPHRRYGLVIAAGPFSISSSRRVFCVIGFPEEHDAMLRNSMRPKKAQFPYRRLDDQLFL